MLLDDTQSIQIDRDSLERLALKRVCACQYYDLADTVCEMSDSELLGIVSHQYACDDCGLKGLL